MNHTSPATSDGRSVDRLGPAPPAARRRRRCRARRSQSARTRAAVRSSVASGSGSSTKSFSVPWPLTNGMPTSLRLRRRASEPSSRSGPASSQVIALVAAEPGPLAADEPAGGLRGRGRGRGHVVVAVELVEDLLVAQRPRRGPALAQARASPARATSSTSPAANIRVTRGVDPRVELARCRGRGRAARCRSAAGPGRGHGRGERAAGQLDDLQRAHDPAAVAGQDRGRGDAGRARPAGRAARRADAASSASSRARMSGSVPGNSRSSRTAARTGRSRRRGSARGPRPAAVDARAGVALVGRDGRGLGDVEDVEQVVRDAAALGRR